MAIFALDCRGSYFTFLDWLQINQQDPFWNYEFLSYKFPHVFTEKTYGFVVEDADVIASLRERYSTPQVLNFRNLSSTIDAEFFFRNPTISPYPNAAHVRNDASPPRSSF
jgi:hypothetical protein